MILGENVFDGRTVNWSRNGQSGAITFGTSAKYGSGLMGVTFDSPSRNFCQIWVYGPKDSTGQQVHDNWFPSAPIGEQTS